jgi:hypothetical protein
MSVMSAAEAGSGPDVPRLRLRVATPADQDDGDPAASPPDAGAAAESDPAASAPAGGRPRLAVTELRATELRVTQVRVVREASVRARAGGSRSVTSRARAASQEQAVQIRAVSRARAASQAGAATNTPVIAEGIIGAAAQARVVTHSRAATQRRVTTRTRTARPGALRLTRRGRLVVTGFALLVAIVTATLLWVSVAGSVQAASSGPAPRSPYQGMTQVVVRPGQTLWSIAAAAEPSPDAWPVVQQIIDVNALNGPQVHAGELLWVPRG